MENREPRNGRIVALLATACVLVASIGFAATVRALSLGDLVRESDAVIRGHVVSERAFRDHRLGIARAFGITVEARLAGECGDRVEVVLLGGELDGAATRVPGEADLAVGDEVLLFLGAARAQGGFRVVGMSQGVFRVVRPPESGRAFATRDLGAVNLVGAPEDDDLGLSRASTSTFLPLEDLEARIVEIATAAGI